jgi:Sulfotransferase domain
VVDGALDGDAGTALVRLPNLVVIGVSKAGTTSLFEYLGMHPDIGLSDVKELRYFTPVRYGEPLAPAASYAEHFRHCTTQRYAAEATPGYFYGGRPLARAMHETCGSVRAVLSLREPADRCWSWFRFVKSRLRIPRELGFDDYLDRCEELHRAGVDGQVEHQPYWGLGGGCYAEWLDGWVEELGPDLRVVFFDDLVQRPHAVMDGLFDWLGLEASPAQTSELEAANRTEQYRSRAVQRVAVSVNRRGEAFFRRHPRLKHGLRSGYYALNRAEPLDTMSAEARDRLAAFYRPYNQRLADQLARLGLAVPAGWS